MLVHQDIQEGSRLGVREYLSSYLIENTVFLEHNPLKLLNKHSNRVMMNGRKKMPLPFK
jgi:hypothetical protein